MKREDKYLIKSLLILAVHHIIASCCPLSVLINANKTRGLFFCNSLKNVTTSHRSPFAITFNSKLSTYFLLIEESVAIVPSVTALLRSAVASCDK